MLRRRVETIGALAALTIALAAALHPLFTRGVSALTGDNPTHSLPLAWTLSDALHGEGFRFWETGAALGFPVYAEGQGGWFHPLRLTIAALFPGLAGHDLLYVVSFFLTGAAALGIALRLGADAGTALVAALASAFSPIVLGTLYNASYAHSIAWASLALLAFEWWYATTSRRSFAIFAASLGLLLLAGYAPTAYAFVLFLGVVLLVRVAVDRSRLPLLVGVAAALVLGIGLAAPQILPLAELTTRSVRQETVDVLNAFPWPSVAGGLVFDSDPGLYVPGRYAYFAAPLATVLSLVAVPFLSRLRDPRAWSYAAGIAVTLGAASGPGAWIFEALRALLPGFDRLRLLSPFVFVAVVPAAVLLALALRLAARVELRPIGAPLAATLVALALLAVTPPAHAVLPWYRSLAIALLAAALLGYAILRRFGRTSALPLVWLAVLGVEITALRGNHRAWLPDATLEPVHVIPHALADELAADPQSRAIHFPSQAYRAVFDGMVLQHWRSPGYAGFVRNGMRLQVPLANLIGGLPSVETSGALPLAGYPELVAAMHEELRGRGAAAGERALDRWGVRWLVLHGDLGRLPRAAGFESIWRDPADDLELLENRHARPRFQWRDDPNGERRLDFVSGWRAAIERLPWVVAQALPAFEHSSASAGTLYAAVPFFPGWTALIDGAPVVPRRAADGFGMEVPLEPGPHRVELRFVPHSFHLGVLISAACVVLLAARARRA